MTSNRTLVGAVRAVLADTAGPDMREVGRAAVALLDDEQVMQAAVTHLAGLARREWNRSNRGPDGSPGPDEIVVTGAAETFLGNTDESDREWLAQNRERLAEGLLDRAVALRSWTPTGAVGQLTSREVLTAERRAASLDSLADALEQLVTSPLDDQRGAAVARIIEARRRVMEMLPKAKEVAAGNWPGGDAARIRRAAGRLKPAFVTAMATIAMIVDEEGLDPT